MKELSIEEKAKRFDEVLSMAKDCITYIPDDTINNYMLDMNTEKPERYASMNYSSYLIAMKAVEIALTNKK